MYNKNSRKQSLKPKKNLTIKNHIKNHIINTKTKLKHKYYIVRCYNNIFELNVSYLENHLKKLGVMPDTKAMSIIKKLDFNKFKIKKTSISELYCSYDRKFDLPKFNKNIISADVFFFNNINNTGNKRFFIYPRFFSNSINTDTILKILNKYEIINNMQKINPSIVNKYVFKTFNINEIDKYEFPKWYILRPIFNFGGADILYINNKKELEDAILYYKTIKKYKSNVNSIDVISSNYITNPLLFNKKKFHLRLYLNISLINGVFNSFLLEIGKIFTAKLPFDMKIPFVKEKHDTHFTSTDDDYLYPDAFTNKNLNKNLTLFQKKILWNKISDICKVISKILEQNKTDLQYPNVQNCYYVFGLDIIIKDNLDPVFIEINISSGVGFKNNDNRDKFSQLYYQWINDTVLEPLFKYNDPMIARKHPTYIDI